jgi:predicted secreted acid phosphatase
MKRLSQLFVLICAIGITLFADSDLQVISPASYTWQEPENHAVQVDRLMRYHDFGEYDREIRDVANSARDYLKSIVKDNPKGDKLAAVFDIDETALSNWNAMAGCGFCSYNTQLELYARAHDPIFSNEHDPAIPPTLELFRFAQQNAVAVFFVTGRRESQRELTIRNLSEVGYSNWTDLYMQSDRRSDQKPEPASIFKPRARRAISDRGYRIILNIGDQASDLAGCCAERAFKLPNPFYLIK